MDSNSALLLSPSTSRRSNSNSNSNHVSNHAEAEAEALPPKLFRINIKTRSRMSDPNALQQEDTDAHDGLPHGMLLNMKQPLISPLVLPASHAYARAREHTQRFAHSMKTQRAARALTSGSGSGSLYDAEPERLMQEPYGLRMSSLALLRDLGSVNKRRFGIAGSQSSSSSFLSKSRSSEMEARIRREDEVGETMRRKLRAFQPPQLDYELTWMDVSECRFLVFVCDTRLWGRESSSFVSAAVETPPPAAVATVASAISPTQKLYNFVGYADSLDTAKRTGMAVQHAARRMHATLLSYAHAQHAHERECAQKQSTYRAPTAESVAQELEHMAIVVTSYVRVSLPLQIHPFCMVRRLVDDGWFHYPSRSSDPFMAMMVRQLFSDVSVSAEHGGALFCQQISSLAQLFVA